MYKPPLSEWSDRKNEEEATRDRQLLKELEALSKALYPSDSRSSQKKTPDHVMGTEIPRNMPSPKKYSLFSRKYFSSLHEPRSRERKNTYVGQDENKSFPPPLDPHHNSRHSTYMLKKKPAVIKSHLSFSDSTGMSPSWAERQAEIRSRRDRRLSLEDVEIENLNKSSSPEKLLDFSQKLDSSSLPNNGKRVWGWKPLRAIAHLGRQKLQCIFSIHVREIECLPTSMNGVRLCVHVRKLETREGAVQTMPGRVFQGTAEFEERMFMKCTLYSNKGHSNTARFMEKCLIISVISPDIDGIDFGKHQLDLSKLLAHLMDEKGSAWGAKLDLTGKAIGGKLAIDIGCEVLSKDGAKFGNTSSRFMLSTSHGASSQLSYSLPNSAHATPVPLSSRDSRSGLEQSDEDKEISIDELNSGDMSTIEKSDVRSDETVRRFAFYERIDFEHVYQNEPEEPVEEEIEFVVIDRGIESSAGSRAFPLNEESRTMDRRLNTDGRGQRALGDVDWQITEEIEEYCATKEAAEELTACELHKGLEIEAHEDDTEKIITVDEGKVRDLALYRIAMENLVPPVRGDGIEQQQSHISSQKEGEEDKKEEEGDMGAELVTGDLKQMMGGSFLHKKTPTALNLDMRAELGVALKDIELERVDEEEEDLDNEVDLVAGEFLKLLESEEGKVTAEHDSEHESPRALLLKQFEEDTILHGCFGIDFEASRSMPKLSLDAEPRDR